MAKLKRVVLLNTKNAVVSLSETRKSGADIRLDVSLPEEKLEELGENPTPSQVLGAGGVVKASELLERIDSLPAEVRSEEIVGLGRSVLGEFALRGVGAGIDLRVQPIGHFRRFRSPDERRGVVDQIVSAATFPERHDEALARRALSGMLSELSSGRLNPPVVCVVRGEVTKRLGPSGSLRTFGTPVYFGRETRPQAATFIVDGPKMTVEHRDNEGVDHSSEIASANGYGFVADKFTEEYVQDALRLEIKLADHIGGFQVGKDRVKLGPECINRPVLAVIRSGEEPAFFSLADGKRREHNLSHSARMMEVRQSEGAKFMSQVYGAFDEAEQARLAEAHLVGRFSAGERFPKMGRLLIVAGKVLGVTNDRGCYQFRSVRSEGATPKERTLGGPRFGSRLFLAEYAGRWFIARNLDGSVINVNEIDNELGHEASRFPLTHWNSMHCVSMKEPTEFWHEGRLERYDVSMGLNRYVVNRTTVDRAIEHFGLAAEDVERVGFVVDSNPNARDSEGRIAPVIKPIFRDKEGRTHWDRDYSLAYHTLKAPLERLVKNEYPNARAEGVPEVPLSFWETLPHGVGVRVVDGFLNGTRRNTESFSEVPGLASLCPILPDAFGIAASGVFGRILAGDDKTRKDAISALERVHMRSEFLADLLGNPDASKYRLRSRESRSNQFEIMERVLSLSGDVPRGIFFLRQDGFDVDFWSLSELISLVKNSLKSRDARKFEKLDMALPEGVFEAQAVDVLSSNILVSEAVREEMRMWQATGGRLWDTVRRSVGAGLRVNRSDNGLVSVGLDLNPLSSQSVYEASKEAATSGRGGISISSDEASLEFFRPQAPVPAEEFQERLQELKLFLLARTKP